MRNAFKFSPITLLALMFVRLIKLAIACRSNSQALCMNIATNEAMNTGVQVDVSVLFLYLKNSGWKSEPKQLIIINTNMTH